MVCTVDIFSPHTIHLRVNILENLYVSYTDMVAILDFSLYSGHLLYNTSIFLFWISSYMYLCLISTHELLLYAAIIFWQIFKICMWIFLN